METFFVRGPVFNARGVDVTEGISEISLDDAIDLAKMNEVGLVLVDEPGFVRAVIDSDGSYSCSLSGGGL